MASVGPEVPALLPSTLGTKIVVALPLESSKIVGTVVARGLPPPGAVATIVGRPGEGPGALGTPPAGGAAFGKPSPASFANSVTRVGASARGKSPFAGVVSEEGKSAAVYSITSEGVDGVVIVGTDVPAIDRAGISGGLVGSYSFLHLMFKSIFLPVFREVKRILYVLSQTLISCTPTGRSEFVGAFKSDCNSLLVESKTLCKNAGPIFKNLFNFFIFVVLLGIGSNCTIFIKGYTAPSLSINSIS